MAMQINQALCTGCGACLDTCPVGAIAIIGQHAAIDDTLCTHCHACLDACPNGAISASTAPVRSLPIVAPPVPEMRIIPAPAGPTVPSMTSPVRGLMPLAGAALAFLGREVAPRLVSVLATALERRLATPATGATTLLPASDKSFTGTGRGRRRQTRCRGNRSMSRNHKGKR